MRRERIKAKQKLLDDYKEYKGTWRAVHVAVLEEERQLAEELAAKEEAERVAAEAAAAEEAKKKAQEEKRLADQKKAEEAAAARALLDRPEREVKPSSLLSGGDFALH